ncbi:hypothetical protein A2763_01160 [Candidatus Kaiserbacteria bacterium RIFCSPHIGHO2_01_FULL_54_36]|uniref:Uncharacterized protein n=1 Tax=Candidatus Kaiserbacteria bacterium RIFCSPHIGHO2_01_FULL_54_36 TaxID=1798482 RepID=A0A1F6CLX4_9BACT|nr:MAG: hypothetical protein A2763_01160 [Candidatus Kaiserbacteria bacterium RIFCSPHIGHO2_01_FULL_54_36]OGG75821.1 MAG: hypothetical protein A3A41_04220 [Candidatus Kaiserbacteria bacterium RIFCSPLOWO2_01_FULL_54_22]
MTQKVSKDWYIAATHYLTAGFAIPFLISAAFTLATIPFIGMDENGNLVNGNAQTFMYFAPIIVGIIATWFGVMYSSRFLKKRYVIPDANRIIKLSTIYFAAIFLIFEVWLVVSELYAPQMPTSEFLEYVGTDVLFGIVGTYIFYAASVKYLR